MDLVIYLCIHYIQKRQCMQSARRTLDALAGKDGGSGDGVGLEVVIDLSITVLSALSLRGRLVWLTLAVYPGSVALKAPGILTVGLGTLEPPPVTLTCAQLM